LIREHLPTFSEIVHLYLCRGYMIDRVHVAYNGGCLANHALKRLDV